MKQFDIKLSGSGTLEELSNHLYQLAQHMDKCSQEPVEHPGNWEDPYIAAEVTEE